MSRCQYGIKLHADIFEMAHNVAERLLQKS
jgi:hypothetical protein